MTARVYSCAVIGLEGVVVEVEIDTGQGLPGMTMAGPINRHKPQFPIPSGCVSSSDDVISSVGLSRPWRLISPFTPTITFEVENIEKSSASHLVLGQQY